MTGAKGRGLSLGAVQEDKIGAAYVDGVLTIKLPKAMQTPKTKVAIK